MELPWQTVGSAYVFGMSSEKALKKGGLDWKVEKVKTLDLQTLNSPIGHKAIVRKDNKRILGTVGEDLYPIQNTEAFTFMDELMSRKMEYETAGSLYYGSITFLCAKMPKEVIIEDEYEPYLLMANDFTQCETSICITPVRVVCLNTLNLALYTAPRVYRIKTTKKISEYKLEALNVLKFKELYMDEFKNTAINMFKNKVTDRNIPDLVEKLLPFEGYNDINKTQKMRVELKDRYYSAPDLQNIRGTQWGFVNAVSDFAYHSKFFTEKPEEVMKSSIYGNNLLDRAFKLFVSPKRVEINLVEEAKRMLENAR